MSERTPHDRLPAEVQGVLSDLRRRIRRYVLIEGVSLVVVVMAALFWASYLADWAYFRISRLELPGWLRSAVLIVMLCALVAGLLTWIVARLLRRLRSRALALVLERRFPELDDRLITAIELTEETGSDASESPLRSAMQQRTITDAAHVARQLDLSAVFDRRPLQRSLTAAILFLASIAGLGIANAAAVHRWYSAFVLGRDNYWDPFRRSALTAGVVAQPGDRFRPLSTDEAYRHPRGADLVIRVDVPYEKEVPEQVTLHYRTLGETGRSRGRVTMTQTGDRSFRHALTGAMDDYQLHVVGGDFTNRRPYRVEIVDPPRIDEMSLDCTYPAYTGMNAFADQLLPVQGTQVSLPVGTSFLLQAEVNKPLVGVRLRCPAFDLSFGRSREVAAAAGSELSSARPNRLRLTPSEEMDRSAQPLELPLAGEWLSEDGRRFELPLIVAGDAAERLSTWDGARSGPLPIPPDVPLQFELHDVDDVRSAEPIRLTINGIADLPPAVETRLRGIGRSITRRARIPVEGVITDDYGVVAARFGYRIDEQTEYEFFEFASSPRGQKKFALGDAAGESVERFNVVPLELSLGQKLILTVFAEDADDVSGPHTSHGETYSFQIVSNDELLALLYDKELNLRLRFEQIISEVEEARDDLAAHHALSLEARALREKTQPTEADEAKRDQINTSLAVAADRRLNSLRKNHTETRAIADLFAEIREELVNNHVDNSSMLERIDDGILAPLHQINEFDYAEVDEAIALYKLVHGRREDPTREIQAAIDGIDAMLRRMAGVLNEMRRRETYNELVKLFQKIRDAEEDLLNKTKEAKIQSLIEGAFPGE